jgi:hypothetical protein
VFVFAKKAKQNEIGFGGGPMVGRSTLEFEEKQGRMSRVTLFEREKSKDAISFVK